MKIRSALLVPAFLMLTSSLASAGPTTTQADPAQPSLAALFSTPAAECASANLPSSTPSPIEAAFICGSCSDPICVGAQRGTVCYSRNGQLYTCQPALATCGVRDCQCWTGPLP